MEIAYIVDIYAIAINGSNNFVSPSDFVFCYAYGKRHSNLSALAVERLREGRDVVERSKARPSSHRSAR